MIFIHVPKTAGQTVSAIVARQYARTEFVSLEGGVGRVRLPADWAPDVRFVIGHFQYGVHKALSCESSYMTMLREPVDRVLSLYRYIISTPQHALHDRVVGTSLLQFAAGSAGSEELENGQTRQIAGVTSGTPTWDSLAIAKENLQRFLAIGIMEHFDESIILFKRRLGWTMPFYTPKNVNEDALAMDPSTEEIEMIRRRNILDVELYRFARRLFAHQVHEEGRSFRFEVAAFRALNAVARSYQRPRDWRSHPRTRPAGSGS